MGAHLAETGKRDEARRRVARPLAQDSRLSRLRLAVAPLSTRRDLWPCWVEEEDPHGRKPETAPPVRFPRGSPACDEKTRCESAPAAWPEAAVSQPAAAHSAMPPRTREGRAR